MHTLRHWNIFHHRQRILLHRLVILHGRRVRFVKWDQYHRPCMHALRCWSIFRECQQRFMHTIDKLQRWSVHCYEWHKQLRSCMHRVDNLHCRPENSRQRNKQHRPYLRSMLSRKILYCNEPEHLLELDHMQCHHRSGKHHRFCHRG